PISENRNGEIVAEWIVGSRATVRLTVPPGGGDGLQLLRLRAPGGGRAIPTNTRIMNFRFCRIEWVAANAPDGRTHSLRETFKGAKSTLARMAVGRARSGLAALLQMPWTVWKSLRLLRKRGGDIFDDGGEFQIGAGWHHLEPFGVQRFRWASSGLELSVRFHDGST